MNVIQMQNTSVNYKSEFALAEPGLARQIGNAVVLSVVVVVMPFALIVFLSDRVGFFFG